MDVSKSIVDVHNGDKLTDKNYDVWCNTMEDLLRDRAVLETITHARESPNYTDVPRINMEEHISFKKKEKIARILILACMISDLMLRFEKHKSPTALWDDVKLQLGGTPRIRMRIRLWENLDLKKRPHTTMREHLAIMSNMIREFKDNGQALSDEQQVLAAIRSLPPSWEILCMVLIHNENIRNFDDVSKHLELHKSVFLDEESQHERNVSRANKRRWNMEEGKMQDNGKGQGCTTKPNKTTKRTVNKAETECYKCKKLGHFVRECTEQEETSN